MAGAMDASIVTTVALGRVAAGHNPLMAFPLAV